MKKKESMETSEINKYITVAYKLYTIEDDGRDLAEEATVEHPFQFISGLGMTLDAFEREVAGLQKGEAFNFTLQPGEAYGEYDEEHVIDLPRNLFLVDGKFDAERIVEGAIVPLMTSEGQRINGSVVEVKPDVVVVDLNHPMAGCALNFVGTVVESRPASGEEMTQAVRMMSGGCGCGCDSCGGGECGGCGGGECGCDGGCDE